MMTGSGGGTESPGNMHTGRKSDFDSGHLKYQQKNICSRQGRVFSLPD
jgi:hypothetical protein